MTAAANIGEQILWRGAPYTLLGVDPMGVAPKQAELLETATGRHLRVPLTELEPMPALDGDRPDSVAQPIDAPGRTGSVVPLRPHE